MYSPRMLLSVAWLGLTLASTALANESTAELRVSETTSNVVRAFIMDGPLHILSDGDVAVTIQGELCDSALEETQPCGDVSVDKPDFSVVGLSGTSISINEGNALNFDWSSEGAFRCEGIGTLPGWSGRGALAGHAFLATTAQRQVGTGGLARTDPYTAGVRCSNGTLMRDSELVAININAVAAPSPTSCEGREPPAGWTRLTTGSLSCYYRFGVRNDADCRVWESLWPGPFLNSAGQPQVVLTNRTGSKNYVALRFNTNGMSPTETGRLFFGSSPATIQEILVTATISQCPGDFNVEQPNGCYFKQGPFTSNFRWGGPSTSRDCVLEPDTVYYLNLINTPSPAGVHPSDFEPDPDCAERLCGSMITPRTP